MVAYHSYLPFGEEASPAAQDAERRKFTGHERDTLGTSSVDDDRDYMHARHYGPLTGRFLSPDRVGGKGRQPQSWNRYAYARGNPLKFVDPDGNRVVVAASAASYVRLGYANSAIFRAQFDRAHSNPAILVFLSIGGSGSLGRTSRAETGWRGNKPPTGQLVTPEGQFYKGVIDSVVRGRGEGKADAKSDAAVAARIGHELDHANGLAKYADLSRAPDARESNDDRHKGETDSALAAESAILDEIGSSGNASLSDGDISAVFGLTTSWDGLTDAQRQECLSDVACMALAGSPPDPR